MIRIFNGLSVILGMAALALLPAAGAGAAEFVCDDGAGGKVVCLAERGDALTRVTCKRGTLFEVHWVCSAFPENDSVLCRSRTGGQRVFKIADFGDDAAVCTSLCFCPPAKN